MNYTVRLINEDNSKNDIVYQVNEFEAAEHFLWAIANRLKDKLGNWQLTLTGEGKDLYHFVRSL